MENNKESAQGDVGRGVEPIEILAIIIIFIVLFIAAYIGWYLRGKEIEDSVQEASE